ncbi:MAG: TIGR01212 family radical SAM protein [Proteobacteria bacterium]|nr:TIGR01212 family radical SAM protein [Pseudomonadota bacterium]
MKNKLYNDLSSYLKMLFGKKVYKITIDSGLTCPNRINGTGCIYCNDRGSGTGLYAIGVDIESQIKKGMEGLKRKYKSIGGYIAYFQSYTNTFAPIELLEKNWSVIKNFKEIVGLSVGTRPDCLSDEVLNLLNSYTKEYKVFLELGLQTIDEDLLKWVNRGHGIAEFIDAVSRASKYNFHIVVHIIIGFMGQDREDMIKLAKFLSNLSVHGVKIHLLYVAKNSPLEKEYEKGLFMPLSREKYVELVSVFLEYLREDIVIHRLTGDAHRGELIAPKWSEDKAGVLKDIVDFMEKNEIYQGKRWN